MEDTIIMFDNKYLVQILSGWSGIIPSGIKFRLHIFAAKFSGRSFVSIITLGLFEFRTP